MNHSLPVCLLDARYYSDETDLCIPIYITVAEGGDDLFKDLRRQCNNVGCGVSLSLTLPSSQSAGLALLRWVGVKSAAGAECCVSAALPSRWRLTD